MSNIQIRKIVTQTEEIYSDGSRPLGRPLRLAAAIAVAQNPYAARYEEDLSYLAGSFSEEIGQQLTGLAVAALGTKPTVFGKGALVGEKGEVQHGSAVIHTRLFGDAMRAATEGIAVVPAAEKRGAMGSPIDMSLRSAHDVGDLSGTDTTFLYSWEVRISDAPHAGEMLIIVALGDGRRPNSRLNEPK